MNAYLHAPAPIVVRALTDWNCPATRRGRCGSYFALASFYEWYGWHVECLFCGTVVQDGEWSRPQRDGFDGRRYFEKLRVRFDEVRAAGGQIGQFPDLVEQEAPR